jgi:hypothetical protein
MLDIFNLIIFFDLFLQKVQIFKKAFSEDEYRVENMDDVLQCGDSGNASSSNGASQKVVQPEYYILLSTKDIKSTGTEQYKLISNLNHSILRFADIPHDIKVFIVNKCIERNAGGN